MISADNSFSISVSGLDLEIDTRFDVTAEGEDTAGFPFSETTNLTILSRPDLRQSL